MSNTQPEALLQRLERLGQDSVGNYGMPICAEAAAELRRLHAEVEELRGALDEAMWHVKYKELKAVSEADTALLRQALEALEKMLDDAKHECVTVTHWNDCVDTITALRERLGEKT